MAAKMSVLGMILSSCPYLSSAMVRFPLLGRDVSLQVGQETAFIKKGSVLATRDRKVGLFNLDILVYTLFFQSRDNLGTNTASIRK